MPEADDGDDSGEEGKSGEECWHMLHPLENHERGEVDQDECAKHQVRRDPPVLPHAKLLVVGD